MIRSYIGCTQDYEVVLKVERLSHLLRRSFRFGYSIRLEAILLVLSLIACM